MWGGYVQFYFKINLFSTTPVFNFQQNSSLQYCIEKVKGIIYFMYLKQHKTHLHRHHQHYLHSGDELLFTYVI